MLKTCLLMISVACAAGALAAASPYAGEQTRKIKALSDAEVHDLLSGRGMGLAMAAELNHYPGPKHVLELAEKLDLSQAQVEAAQAVFARMEGEARRLGRQFVDLEAELDRLFASGDAAPQSVDETLQAIGRVRAALRGAHLAAHLEMKQILSRHQIAAYDRLRGYAEGATHRHDHHHDP